MRRNTAIAGCGLTLLTLLAGCGGPKPVKVSGKVLLKGEPVDGANVQFVPSGNGGRPATGSTGADGQFELTTIENKDGALPGEYKVVVTYSPPVETAPGGNTEQIMKQVISQQQKDAKKKPKYVIPKDYSSVTTTPVTQKVPADGPVTIDIK